MSQSHITSSTDDVRRRILDHCRLREWQVDSLDLEGYLARVGNPVGPDAQPDARTLALLHRAHVAHIPFENIDVTLGRPVSVALADGQTKLVDDGRGGYCRGNEPADASLGLLDMTPFGRGEAWQDNPPGWPEFPRAGAPIGGQGAPICWYWRTDAGGVATWGPTSRPTPQWTRPGADPVDTLGRRGAPH